MRHELDSALLSGTRAKSGFSDPCKTFGARFNEHGPRGSNSVSSIRF